MMMRGSVVSVAVLFIASGCAFPYIDLGDLPVGGASSTPEAGGGKASGGSPALGGSLNRGGAGGAESGGAGGASSGVGIEDIALGWYHDCAALMDGSVRCWGSNYGGQLGDGSLESSATPVQVLGLSSGVRNVEASYTDSCAALWGGGFSCWGSNLYGQLGNGSTAMSVTTPTPVVTELQSISLGEYHSCGQSLDGTVLCWGYGEDGSLGDGRKQSSATPVAVSGLDSSVQQVSAGAVVSCALLADGSVSCWGTNSGSDVCSGTNIVHSTPVAVTGVSDVLEITAGSTHACARHVDGGVSCWGLDSYGQLGTSATTLPAPCTNQPARPPARVASLDHVVQIAAGDGHTCALRDNGEVYCWGRNEAGQLGDGTTTSRPEPKRVLNVAGASSIRVGYSQSCALFLDGSALCWGAPSTPSGPAEARPVPYALQF